MTEEETVNIVTLLEDLETDLRNGNVPAAKLLIISLINCLTRMQPLEWKMIGEFVKANLDDHDCRLALLRVVPKVRELICPSQPDQEAAS